MINIDEFNRVCRLAGLMQVGKQNTWTTEKKEEGIELVQNKICSFAFKDGERNYDVVIIDQKIHNVLGAFEKEIEEQKTGKKVEVKNEIHETTDEIKGVEKTEKAGIIPENLTKKLFEKWQGLSVFDRLIMLQNIDGSQIEMRTGRDGQEYRYVPISYMIRSANIAFGYAWSVRVMSWTETETEIICNIELMADLNGKIIIKAATGHKYIALQPNTKEVLCKGADYNSAQDDAIKNALHLFGIAQDVSYREKAQ